MRRLVTSFAVETRLQCAAEFIARFPMDEVLVVAPTRTAADELVRRRIGHASGVIGVHRFTLPQLAFALSEERLARDGKTLLAGVAMDALAARSVQACRSANQLSWFDPVATTPGFFRSLAATIHELRLNGIGCDVLFAAGGAAAGRDLAHLLDYFDRYLHEADTADLAAAYKTATTVIAEPEFRFRGRPLLLLDVSPTSLFEQEVIRALADAAADTVATVHHRDPFGISALQDALGVHAEPMSSETSQHALARLRANIFETVAPAGQMDSSVDFVSATDESRECIEIARSILASAQAGVPFDQMAIVLRNPTVYQPLVEDALRRAGIPGYFTLGSRRPNAAGRALLALLACASEGLSASRFSEYLSLGQVPNVDKTGKPAPADPGWVPVQGELFPDFPTPEVTDEPEENDDDQSPVISGSLRTPYQWEKLLVDASVIGGRDRWARRLDGLANEFRKRIAEVRAEDESAKEHLERQIDRLANLRRFALPLIEFLDHLPQRASWGDWLDALEALAVTALRRPEFVLSVLCELRPMSNLGPVGLDEVREILNHRLTFLRTDSPERRYGKVFVAVTDEVAGLSFETIFLPGLAEGIFPKKAFEDPLLLDDARRSISPWLATQNTRIGRERLLLHIAAGAARSKLWVSYPRMDHAQDRSRSPSFYALDLLRSMTGSVPSLSELQRGSTLHTRSQIGWPAPRDARAAIDDAEYDLAVISELMHASPEDLTGRARYLLTANPSLSRSLRSRAGRWRKRWMDGDGIVADPHDDAEVLNILAGHRPGARPYSATALQQFAVCPYRFALYAIHRMQPRTEAQAIERLDALTRGSLLHNAQFRLLSELRALDLLPINSDNLAGVTIIADRVFDETANSYREELAPAIPRVWESQIEDIRWDLRGWLREMSQPASGAWTPRWFELSFGLPKAREKDPASRDEPIELPGGVRVRGAIDMIEERDGTIRITDHKTGKAPMQPPGLTGRGEVLQPILYGPAAEVLLGKPAASARLFFCTERGGYQSYEVPIDDYSRECLSRVITLIDGSITTGFLPAAPREGGCMYCDYKLICGPYEERRFHRKSKDRLGPLKELREAP